MRVRWYRRVAFRLALVLVLAMLAFDKLSPLFADFTNRALGRPTEVLYTIYDGPDLAERLLAGALEREPGVWDLHPSAARQFAADLAELGQTFVWLDTSGRVVDGGGGLPIEVGDRWKGGFETAAASFSFEQTETPDRESLRGIVLPLELDGAHAGYLVRLVVDKEAYALWLGEDPQTWEDNPDNPFGTDPGVLVTPEQGAALTAGDTVLYSVITFALVAASAVLLAWVTSRWVTRRLSRLASQAASLADAGGSVPRPFDERGADEIAALASALNRMHGRINELVVKLGERDAKRRELIAQVSHDLRTPLTALHACLDRMDRRLERNEPLTDRERLQLVGSARFDAGRVLDLAEDLFELSRLDAEEVLTIEPVPPGELGRNALAGLDALARSRGVELQGAIEPGLPTLDADGRRLLRGLENLIKNAIEHATAQVRLAVCVRSDRVCFEVSDDGPGWPAAPGGGVDLDAVRQRKSRADSAGLGLLVVQRVAEAHGGSLRLSNIATGGALASVELPITGQLANRETDLA